MNRLMIGSVALVFAVLGCHSEPLKTDPETQRAIERLPENGIVISVPGKEPIVIEPGSREVSALGGKVKFIHVFKDDVPVPAHSDSVQVASAGPIFVPASGSIGLRWLVIIEPRGSGSSLSKVARVEVEDISGDAPLPLIDSPADLREGSLFAQSPATPFTRSAFPWMFTDTPSLFVLRITLHGEKDEVLLQPVLIGTEVKQRVLKKLGAA